MNTRLDFADRRCIPALSPGNPATHGGRPRGTMDTLRLIDKIVNKKVAATVDGRPLKITKKQAMLLRLANAAAQRDMDTFKILLPLLMQIDARKAARCFARIR